MKQLDEAIELLTRLRIQVTKEKRPDLEQKLHEIETLIFQSYDNIPGKVTPINFKELRNKNGFTLRDVEEKTGISNAYLSQLENGKIKRPSFEVMETLNKFYNQ
jgi:DNA-binding Xre family transcriptional regulator